MVLLARLLLVAGALSARRALSERALTARHLQDGHFVLDTDTVDASIQTLDRIASMDPTEGMELAPHAHEPGVAVPSQNPYRVLGVSPTASHEEIKKARDKLALKWHPDKNHEAGAEEKWQAINKAYELVGDEDERKKFDASGKLKVEVHLPEEFLHACTLSMRREKNEEVIKLLHEQVEKCTQGLLKLTEKAQQESQRSAESNKEYGDAAAKVAELVKKLEEKGINDAFHKDVQAMVENLLGKLTSVKGEIQQLAITGPGKAAAATAAL
jgi:uncharacterized protein YjgD (DUF1641 family)